MGIEATLEALGEEINRQKQENYTLRRTLDLAGRYETTLIEVRKRGDHFRQALVNITWAEDLEEAKEQARRALQMELFGQ